jgi:hypothetical protein
MTSDFVDDVVTDAAGDLLSTLLVAGVTSGLGFVSRTLRKGIQAGLERLDTHRVLETRIEPRPVERGVAEDTGGVQALGIFDLLDEREELTADTAAYEFLMALHYGDYRAACGLCAHSVFDHPERKAVLLDTLQAAPPAGWTWIETREMEQARGGGITHVMFDLDVDFCVDETVETIPLQIYVRWLGAEWKVWQIHWGPAAA